MALSLHTTKKYQIEYGQNAINGWDNVEEFINYLREKQRNGSSIWINEEETDIEIPFDELEEMKKDEKWGATAELIWDNSDHTNYEAHLQIW